ncbi:MAG: sulfite exporter TauE/SafE family protein, partial [Planctomycetota bacterium]|nr:sulfite exporter TauE/SafE family protein [Planctomycetota bacterium]
SESARSDDARADSGAIRPKPRGIDARRLLVTVALPIACAMLVLGTFAFAQSEERTLVLTSALVAAAAGFAASSIGVYGGVLVPGLLLLGVDARFSAAVSMFLQVLVIPLGAGAHVRLGNVRKHVAVPLIVGGMAGSFTGPFLAASLPKDVVGRVVAGVIVAVGVLVLATLRWGGIRESRPVEEVSRARIGSVGLVAGLASGISGAGWGPIGVKLLILLRIEPREAIGSSLLGRVFMAATAVIAYALGAAASNELKVDWWLLLPLFAGSLATIVPGVYLVSSMKRERAVVVITLISIALALPVLLRGT